MKPTNEQITAAARALSNDNADVCNVNREDNWNIYGDSFRETARVALEAALASTEAAARWKLAPVEPTDDMEAAAEDDYENTGATFPKWKSAYRAMLAAAPVAQPIYQVWVEETSSYADVTPEYYAERLPSNRRIVYSTPAAKLSTETVDKPVDRLADEAWIVKAAELQKRCSLWPEKTSEGFMALLELRNHVEALLKTRASDSATASDKEGA